MTERLTAVREGDMLKLVEPVDLPEGRQIELQVVRILPDEQEAEKRVRSFLEAIAALQEEAARHPEWWDELDREVKEHRLNIPERFLPGDEE
jgi:predicted DNA-binding antitoxin AbrB/MazE fold protein